MAVRGEQRSPGRRAVWLPRGRLRKVLLALFAAAAISVALAGRILAWDDDDAPTAARATSAPAAKSRHGVRLAQRPFVQVHRARRARPAQAPSVYLHDHAGHLSSLVSGDPPRVYVPNSDGNSVDVIDQQSMKVIASFAVGALPQHITPSYDLRTLYVEDDVGNNLIPIDPLTGKAGKPIGVADPYNLYFTPGGRYAVVVAERLARLDFRDAHSFRLHHSLPVPCRGVNHLDFSGDGRYAIASCEFSRQLIKLDVRRERILGTLTLPRRLSIPQDVRVAPDGRLFYVADLAAGGVWKVDGRRFKVLGFIRTGAGAHGFVVSRNGRFLYVSNRNQGSVSVISFRKQGVVANWQLPAGSSPDMGGVSADGKVLWLSGRYSAQVYAIDTISGRLLARIGVGAGPHGICVWPQPGLHSLGHTGELR